MAADTEAGGQEDEPPPESSGEYSGDLLRSRRLSKSFIDRAAAAAAAAAAMKELAVELSAMKLPALQVENVAGQTIISLPLLAAPPSKKCSFRCLLLAVITF